MRKEINPQFGQTTFQLTDIVRAEPDASLFQVPGHYTIKSRRPWASHERGAKTESSRQLRASAGSVRSIRTVRPSLVIDSAFRARHKTGTGPPTAKVLPRQRPVEAGTRSHGAAQIRSRFPLSVAAALPEFMTRLVEARDNLPDRRPKRGPSATLQC